MKTHRFFEHTGDLGVIIYGKNPESLFEHAAGAFFHVVTDPETIREIRSERIALEADGYEDLLVSWLGEFLYLFDAKGLLFARYDVELANEKEIRATVRGEPYDPERHPIETTIKAVTYHRIEVKNRKKVWWARVIFDL